MVFADYERLDRWDSLSELQTMDEDFRKDCDKICPNEDVLCNIILDVCYKKNSTKKFVWSMCGHNIIHNLLKKNECRIQFPTIDTDGNISYCGDTYSVKSKGIEVDE